MELQVPTEPSSHHSPHPYSGQYVSLSAAYTAQAHGVKCYLPSLLLILLLLIYLFWFRVSCSSGRSWTPDLPASMFPLLGKACSITSILVLLYNVIVFLFSLFVVLRMGFRWQVAAWQCPDAQPVCCGLFSPIASCTNLIPTVLEHFKVFVCVRFIYGVWGEGSVVKSWLLFNF